MEQKYAISQSFTSPCPLLKKVPKADEVNLPHKAVLKIKKHPEPALNNSSECFKYQLFNELDRLL
jgi:hypothetical protein